ncbi:MAG: AraC family transcriptional regulator [Polyangiaceae bacterium]|nr:AraC family transcriptional regulator [Polyangiaceae bacterium]
MNPSMKPSDSKYGAALATEGWEGFPMRVGAYLGQGRTEGLVATDDTVLLWTGGVSDVVIHARAPHRGPAGRLSFRFSRQGGMIDFIAKDTVLDEVRWSGQPYGCIAVALERERVERLLGTGVPRFDPQKGLRVNATDDHIVDLVRRLEQQAVQKEPWGAPYVEGLSLTLASYVYGRYAEAKPQAAPQQLLLSETEKLVAFVEDHLSEEIRLADLAKQVGCTPDHLTRMFKRSFGVPLHQYIVQRRVERAKALLRGRSHTIAEVAWACGFATQSHFSAVFRARMGMTPSAYRR